MMALRHVLLTVLPTVVAMEEVAIKKILNFNKELAVGILILILIIILIYFFTFPKNSQFSNKLNLEKESYVLVPFDWIKEFQEEYEGDYRLFYIKPVKGYPCVNCEFATSREEEERFIDSILAYVTTKISHTEIIMKKHKISYIAMPKPESYATKLGNIFKIYILFIYGKNKSQELFRESNGLIYFNRSLVFMRLLSNSLGSSNLTKFYEDEKFVIYKLTQ